MVDSWPYCSACALNNCRFADEQKNVQIVVVVIWCLCIATLLQQLSNETSHFNPMVVLHWTGNYLRVVCARTIIVLYTPHEFYDGRQAPKIYASQLDYQKYNKR